MHKTRALLKRFLLLPIHPFLFGAYYVLRLYIVNAAQVPERDLGRPLLISLLGAGVLFLIFLLIVRSNHTAAFMASAVLFLFYSYYEGWVVLPIQRTLERIFPILWLVFTLIIIVWLGRSRRKDVSDNAIAGVNLMSIALLLSPAMQGIRYYAAIRQPFTPQVSHIIEGKPSLPLPDIYYIILDSYPRADVLMEEYGYDNSEFLRALKGLGFYVAECSQSNYPSTEVSLTSSLNLDYLQVLSDTIAPEENDLWSLFKMLDENAVQASVSNMGYETISFASGFPWAEWRDADVFIAPPEGPITEFETTLLFSSYARTLHDLGFANYTDIHAERYRARTRLVLGTFENLVLAPGPKFVFIHLIVPHGPFAFDENGNPVAPNLVQPGDGYLAQVKFINRAILPGLKTLIEKSTTPPVILLQGDHGPSQDQTDLQVKILNAYYLPDGAELLYPGISPVNSFRVVFNTYFGAEFPLLEDISYVSDGKRYDFSVMPNTCP